MSYRQVKLALGIFAVLLSWMAWPVGQPKALANGLVGSTGCVDDTWTATSTDNPPSPRGPPTAVWTGAEMIVWGLDGRRYDPASDTWVATSMDGAPSARFGHTAVWTGTEMIVWGGEGFLNTGGRYDPATDTWAPTSTINAPSARAEHTAVWTGSEMIVWGGIDFCDDETGRCYATNTGGRYDPATDTWRATSVVGVGGAYGHTAVWTGTEMLVWGAGASARYYPAADAWRAISRFNAPTNRFAPTAVWTGTQMVVWGGVNYIHGVNVFYNTGGQYDPVTDTWMASSMDGVPTARWNHTAVWTGSEMLIWGGAGAPYEEIGGCPGGPFCNTGARYDPATDTWAATSTVGVPSPRWFHESVWTGTEMIVWGGTTQQGGLDSGGRYCASAR